MSSRKLQSFLAFVLLLALGCGTVSSEPDSTYEDLPPQAYAFDTIWECAIEACEDLGFHLDDSSRDGANGSFVTNTVEIDKDLVRRTRLGHRLRGKISPNGEGTFRMQVAASRFEEEEGEAWSYLAPDPDLQAKFRAKFKQKVAARYTPVDGGK